MLDRRPRTQRTGAARLDAPAVQRFIARHGWRAYALPILVAATIWALFGMSSQPVSAAADHRAAAARPTDTHPAPAATPSASAGPATGSAEAQAASAADVAHCAGNRVDQLILVSTSAQHAWICSRTTLLKSTAVTTGRLTDNDETQPGTWTIQAKQSDRTLNGPGYSEHVDYWMPYNGDFGLHDATFQTFPFGGAQWRTEGSHGCVHFPLATMAWLYGWADVGATVTITA